VTSGRRFISRDLAGLPRVVLILVQRPRESRSRRRRRSGGGSRPPRHEQAGAEQVQPTALTEPQSTFSIVPTTSPGNVTCAGAWTRSPGSAAGPAST